MAPIQSLREGDDVHTTHTPELLFLGSRARVLATAEDTAGAFAIVDMLEVPPGSWSPLHVHHREDEGFYVVSGEAAFYLPDRKILLRSGDFFLAPKGVPHTYEAGPEGARWIVTTSPAGFERFVEETAALERPDPEHVGAIAARHGIEILGPPGATP